MAPNDIYILLSYGAGAIVLILLGLVSWLARNRDQRDLRKLEQQMRDLSEK